MEKYRLVLTCGACPEQYDVFLGDKEVGYLRLRHGAFRADVPSCGGETVYQASPNGDGMFHPDERNYYLNEACKAITEYLESGRVKGKKEPEYLLFEIDKGEDEDDTDL